MERILRIIIVALIVLVTLALIKDMVFKISIEKTLEIVTGLKLNVKSFSFGIFGNVVSVKGLRLFNPKGFPEKVMVDMPALYVKYDASSLLKRKIHLQEIRIDLKEFIVVKNGDGKLNIDSLEVVRAYKEGRDPRRKQKSLTRQMRIDVLDLKINKAVYKDYSKGAAPSVKEFNIDLDERYRNITDPYVLVSLVIVKALNKTSMSESVSFDIEGLGKTISYTLSSAQNIAQQSALAAQKTSQDVINGTGETIKKATQGVGEAFNKTFRQEGAK